MDLHYREWGSGDPVIAMAPLGLESSAFAGLGRTLARHGWRTIGVDLPGFGRTPAPQHPLTPAVLAQPVIALARTLERPPVVLGVSLGGRVALEAAVTAPDAFRSVIPIAPFLPWRRFRPMLDAAAIINPDIADWMPLERAWPLLRWLAHLLETTPYVRDDELAQAGARLVYFMSCPATRRSLFSAGRELALDPGHGPASLWARLPHLSVPTAFVWAERDRMISLRFSSGVARHCPQARQLLLPCLGHWLNGAHHRCLSAALGPLLDEIEGRAPYEPSAGVRAVGAARLGLRPCVVGGQQTDEWVPHGAGFEEGRHVG